MKLTFIKFQSEEKINLDLDNPVIIGRGSFFKCFDKRVSRNHGQVHLTPDGKVHLIALNSNPCFMMKNGLHPVIKLDKNDDKILDDGDYVGLLPDSFWYKVEFSKSESIIMNNSLARDKKTDTASDSSLQQNTTQIINHNAGENSSECQPITSDVKIQTETIADIKENIAEKTNPKESLEERLKSLKNTQKLPLYMYEIDDFPEEYSETNIKEIPPSAAEEKENSINQSSEQDEDSAVKDATICNVSEVDSQPNGEFLTHCAKYNVENIDACKVDVNSDEFIKENIAHTSKITVNENNDDLCGNRNNCPQSKRRPICQYESNCYRKNLQHKKDYSHPGDPDFIPYEKREYCRFGSSCHRQNKNHQTNYRHPKKKSITRPPSDSPRGKRRKKAEHQDVSDDLVDFINDESSDDLDFTNDGSSDEFIPSESYSASSTSETEDF